MLGESIGGYKEACPLLSKGEVQFRIICLNPENFFNCGARFQISCAVQVIWIHPVGQQVPAAPFRIPQSMTVFQLCDVAKVGIWRPGR